MKTDWEDVLSKLNIGEDAKYILEQSDEDRERISSLLPYHINDFKDIRALWKNPISLIIEAVINTIKEYGIEKVPNKLEFVGCFRNNKRVGSKDLIILSFNDLFNMCLNNELGSYRCVCLNPNIIRLIKIVTGDALKDVTIDIGKNIFTSTITNERNYNVRRACGLSYERTCLSEEELMCSSNFIRFTDLVIFTNSLKCIIPTTDFCMSSSRTFGYALMLKYFVNWVEVNKRYITGYVFSDELNEGGNLECVNKRLAESLILEDSDCNAETAIYCYLLKYTLGDNYDFIPMNYTALMKKHNLSLEELLICTQVSIESDYIYKFKYLILLQQKLNYNYTKVVIMHKDNYYYVYRARIGKEQKLKYTSFAKAVMKRFDIDEIDIIDKLYLFEDVVSEELLGEACLIQTLVDEKKYYLPILDKYYKTHSYYSAMRCLNLPIGLLKDR